jgi:tRNA threonylcarbamoyladenosine biosynthesis protein TsaE
LIQTYDGEGRKVAHMDWYRLEDANEIEMLGVRDYFEPPWITIIEWPERALKLLPQNMIRFHLSCVDGNPGARLIRKEGGI